EWPPPPGASPPMHDCIMVRIKRPYRIQVCGTKMCPNGELPSDPQQIDRHRQTLKLCKKPLSKFIIAPRAQASRRCETQATLAFRSLDPFRALREPDPRRWDEKRPFPLRTKNCQHYPKQPLDRKSPIQVSCEPDVT